MKHLTQGAIDNLIKSMSCKHEETCKNKTICNICPKHEQKKENT